jgi:hypothetical protein
MLGGWNVIAFRKRVRLVWSLKGMACRTLAEKKKLGGKQL